MVVIGIFTSTKAENTNR